jgi:hypothetical protein
MLMTVCMHGASSNDAIIVACCCLWQCNAFHTQVVVTFNVTSWLPLSPHLGRVPAASLSTSWAAELLLLAAAS